MTKETEATLETRDNAVLLIPTAKLRVHPVNRQIYVNDEKRKIELLESIKEHGILEPLIVAPDGEGYSILSGARRFECARELGYTKLPCIVAVVENQALAIIEHNKYRQKNPIEVYNEAQLLKELLKPLAKEHQGMRTDLSPNLAKSSEPIDVRKITAERIGVSHGYLSMLEEVMENREEIPDVVKRLETGRETVYSAYKQLKALKTGDITIPNLFIGHYFAGKQRLVKDIIARMPEHHCYVEPFGGFCSVLLNKPVSEVEVYNDINKDVVNLLLCIKEYPFDLFSELIMMPYSRALYEQLIGILDEPFQMPDPKRAAQWYYINESTFSGIHSAKVYSGTWRHGVTRNHALQIRRNVWRLFAVSKRLYRVHIENKDYQYILDHYDGEDTLFYLDPPYYQTDDALGISWTRKEHEELQKRLKVLKGKWLLTYNDAPEVMDLYNGYSVERITLPQSAPDSKQTGGLREYYNQLIITNYKEATT